MEKYLIYKPFHKENIYITNNKQNYQEYGLNIKNNIDNVKQKIQITEDKNKILFIRIGSVLLGAVETVKKSFEPCCKAKIYVWQMLDD